MRMGMTATLLLVLMLAGTVAVSGPHGSLERLGRDDGALPKKLWPKGKRITSVRWRDRGGLNIAAFSEHQAAANAKDPDKPRKISLYVRHYVERAGRWRKLRQVKDYIHTCGLDLTAEFILPSLQVTDLDRDGQGELTFAYRLACRGDVSPAILKLVVLERGAKYILRGSTRIAGDGGTFRVDPSFRRGPAAFLRHAKAVWRKVVEER